MLLIFFIIYFVSFFFILASRFVAASTSGCDKQCIVASGCWLLSETLLLLVLLVGGPDCFWHSTEQYRTFFSNFLLHSFAQALGGASSNTTSTQRSSWRASMHLLGELDCFRVVVFIGRPGVPSFTDQPPATRMTRIHIGLARRPGCLSLSKIELTGTACTSIGI